MKEITQNEDYKALRANQLHSDRPAASDHASPQHHQQTHHHKRKSSGMNLPVFSYRLNPPQGVPGANWDCQLILRPSITQKVYISCLMSTFHFFDLTCENYIKPFIPTLAYVRIISCAESM